MALLPVASVRRGGEDLQGKAPALGKECALKVALRCFFTVLCTAVLSVGGLGCKAAADLLLLALAKIIGEQIFDLHMGFHFIGAIEFKM